MNLQLDMPTRPPTWARRYADAFPTYVGTRPAPAPPPLAPVDGLLEVDEALRILEQLFQNRRVAAELPTLVVGPAEDPSSSWSELLEEDDEEVDLDLFCASFLAPDREHATA